MKPEYLVISPSSWFFKIWSLELLRFLFCNYVNFFYSNSSLGLKTKISRVTHNKLVLCRREQKDAKGSENTLTVIQKDAKGCEKSKRDIEKKRVREVKHRQLGSMSADTWCLHPPMVRRRRSACCDGQGYPQLRAVVCTRCRINNVIVRIGVDKQNGMELGRRSPVPQYRQSVFRQKRASSAFRSLASSDQY